jgi:glycosyltransferase involved in cell wall biosynthesis
MYRNNEDFSEKKLYRKNMKNPLVSVIIPCHNQGIYLQDALDSVFQQTYQNLEIIIINDGSDDDFTLQKLQEMRALKLKIIDVAVYNPSIIRNIGIENCTGEYIVPLDADDILDKNFVEKSLAILLNNNKLGAVSSWTMLFGERDNLQKYKSGGIENYIYYTNATITALFSKKTWEAVGGYDPAMIDGAEDWDFWLGVTSKGWDIEIIQEPLFFYRIKKQSRNIDAGQKFEGIKKKLTQKHEAVFGQYFG